MSDLISRQAVVDAIEQHKTAVLEEREWHEGIAWGYATAHRHLVDVVKQLPSAQPNWIPCSERLPAPWTFVLVTYIYNGKRFVEESQYAGQDDERGNPLFISYADEYKVRDAYFQKIAWMPLPNPYEGREE